MKKLSAILFLAASLLVQTGCWDIVTERDTSGHTAYTSAADWYDPFGYGFDPFYDWDYYETEYYGDEWVMEDDYWIEEIWVEDLSLIHI